MSEPLPVTCTHLPVTEIFGPTWQGEGPHAGRVAHFLRLGHCNLSCEWCDSAETWDRDRYDLAETITETPTEEIVAALAGAPLVVLTGGEPLMHQRRRAFADVLASLECPVHVETNGTITPTGETLGLVDHFTVSPKHATTADTVRKRIKPVALRTFAQMATEALAGLPEAVPGAVYELTSGPSVCFKFVCRDPGEVASAAELVEDYEIPRAAVWVMPEGTSAEQVVATGRRIAGAVAERGWHFSTRLHTLIWDNEKGR